MIWGKEKMSYHFLCGPSFYSSHFCCLIHYRLGKTLQALVAVAISHTDIQANSDKKSLVVCPASVVGHWVNEINRFFPGGALLAPIAYTGTAKARRASWSDCSTRCNVVVTSYSVLRTDVDLLESVLFDYCILDEGHLLKNPKTATAKASRRLKARHRLILTGEWNIAYSLDNCPPFFNL